MTAFEKCEDVNCLKQSILNQILLHEEHYTQASSKLIYSLHEEVLLALQNDNANYIPKLLKIVKTSV
jgi:hypothetical protein